MYEKQTTTFILCHTQTKIVVKYNNEIITQTQHFTYLGVIFLIKTNMEKTYLYDNWKGT